MNILLTGGTGFLGGEYIDYAHKKNMIFSTYRKKPGKILRNVIWVKLDLAKKDDFDRVFQELKNKKIDVVIHMGGSTPNRAYSEGNFNSTVKGTEYLLGLSKKLNIKKFVFISSSSVHVPKKGPYAESKLIAESYIKKSGLTYTILRPTTIIGKNARDFNITAKILRRKKIFPIVGFGNNLKRPIASSDVIRIVEYCTNNKITDNKTYDIFGREAISLRNFLKKIANTNNNHLFLLPIPFSIALLVATIINKINPRLGLNQERIRIISHSARYDIRDMKDFKSKLKSFEEMIDFLYD